MGQRRDAVGTIGPERYGHARAIEPMAGSQYGSARRCPHRHRIHRSGGRLEESAGAGTSEFIRKSTGREKVTRRKRTPYLTARGSRRKSVLASQQFVLG